MTTKTFKQHVSPVALEELAFEDDGLDVSELSINDQEFQIEIDFEMETMDVEEVRVFEETFENGESQREQVYP